MDYLLDYQDVAENWNLWVQYMPESDCCRYWWENTTVEERIAKQIEVLGPEQ